MEAKSARKYMRAANSVCGRGVRRVGLAHYNSLTSRKYGRPSGLRLRICAHSWMECSQRGLVFCRISVFWGNGCSSAGHPSSSVMIGILTEMEVEIWLPNQISDVPRGCKFAVSSVAMFLPIIDGHVAWPLWV